MPEALLIVDYQNDFNPGGAVPVPGADEIAEHINALAAVGRYAVVIAARDWHPPDHASFTEQGGTCPEHCVAGTPGAELHPALDRSRIDVVLDKGTEPGTNGSSAFDGTNLGALLREHRIDRVTIVGLATDYCVMNTALDALQLGFGVNVDSSAVRGVDRRPGDSDRALEAVRAAGAAIA